MNRTTGFSVTVFAMNSRASIQRPLDQRWRVSPWG
jgi:hypothetical protein